MAHEKGSGMPYLSGILGTPVVDADGEKIGVVSDVGAAVREVFPRVTALAFKGPAKVPFMISWRKYVDSFTDDLITLNVRATEVRFSYLQPDELLLKRDLMNKQIVDTQGMKVVRVNDLKLSRTGDDQLRLLGAEVGVRGILRGIGRGLEKVVCAGAKALGQPIPERIIAWSYMDLLDRDISQVKLSVTPQIAGGHAPRRHRRHHRAARPAAALAGVPPARHRQRRRGDVRARRRVPGRRDRRPARARGPPA